MLAVLSAEKRTLVERRLEELAGHAEEKNALNVDILQLEKQLKHLLSGHKLEQASSDKENPVITKPNEDGQMPTHKLTHFIKSLPTADQSLLKPLHESLKVRIQEIKHENDVNGKIVNRSQQSTRELIKLLTRSENTVYTAQGHTHATTAGQAIAQV